MVRRARVPSAATKTTHEARLASPSPDPGLPPRSPASGPALAVLDPPAAVTSCRLPSPSPRVNACRALRVVLAATAVGLLTGFFGVGGGFVIVPALVLALGFEMPAAVGTSLLVITINAVTALTARLGTHVHIDWALLAAFTGAAVAGSFAGNRVNSAWTPAS